MVMLANCSDVTPGALASALCGLVLPPSPGVPELSKALPIKMTKFF